MVLTFPANFCRVRISIPRRHDPLRETPYGSASGVWDMSEETFGKVLKQARQALGLVSKACAETRSQGEPCRLPGARTAPAFFIFAQCIGGCPWPGQGAALSSVSSRGAKSAQQFCQQANRSKQARRLATTAREQGGSGAQPGHSQRAQSSVTHHLARHGFRTEGLSIYSQLHSSGGKGISRTEPCTSRIYRSVENRGNL